jgi:hypothetical protein
MVFMALSKRSVSPGSNGRPSNRRTLSLGALSLFDDRNKGGAQGIFGAKVSARDTGRGRGGG